MLLSHDDVVSPGVLNFECGADFVKMYQKAPKGVELPADARACSLDGDADRIVFYFTSNGSFRLLDGDKIATLAAKFIMTKIKEAGATKLDGSPLNIGLVQTA